ncbi:P-type conjugative transfer protein TrbJ [Mariluticola halotolerans]|uniref:P-type conjugative transfer protein TrbJ n=1 Tax=Mariluticola halotolerans TaxID=2909283 RepID=UPI0026E25BC4|nr:P-type conjugative transfer protein TrbJ [Mariluticola halotolerans]UJQ94145.1 P-type conjugative transfer protein TrbJ [Mariluticola halotolerans]
MKKTITAMSVATLLALLPIQPAQALFGFGDTVYDPLNHAENILTAARSLEQINNQVQQLANEAQMLINQAKNLANLPMSVASNLQSSLSRVDSLMREAEGIAYDISSIDEEFQRLFPDQYDAATTTSEILQDAEDAWKLAREGFKHSLEVQAEVVGQVRDDAVLLDQLVASSQSAIGNLQAVQAGNQLTALAAKQSMQLQTLLAASSRADALEQERALATHEQGQARFERFVGTGSAYTRR